MKSIYQNIYPDPFPHLDKELTPGERRWEKVNQRIIGLAWMAGVHHLVTPIDDAIHNIGASVKSSMSQRMGQ
jgi:hypothetical protein